MDDFRVRLGFFDHPKTIKLQRRCGAEGVLCFLRLWEFCTKTKDRHKGDLTGLDNEEIEIAAGWTGQEGKLISTLVKVGYLDGECEAFKIHEWEQYQPFVYYHDVRSEQAKRAVRTRWDKCQNTDRIRTEYAADTPTPTPTPTPNPNPNPNPSPADAREIPDNEQLNAAKVEELGSRQYGVLGGVQGTKIVRLCPILGHELKQAMGANGKSWGYFTKVVESIRDENSKSKPLPGKDKNDPFAGWKDL